MKDKKKSIVGTYKGGIKSISHIVVNNFEVKNVDPKIDATDKEIFFREKTLGQPGLLVIYNHCQLQKLDSNSRPR